MHKKGIFKFTALIITLTLFITSTICPLNVLAVDSNYFDLIDNSPLEGYEYAFFGDSISYGEFEKNIHELSQMMAWGGRIKKKHGIRSRNVSFSGAAVSTNKEINQGRGVAEKDEVWTILKQLNKIWDSGYNPDVYVLHGGVNDCGTNTRIGSLSPYYDGLYNRANFIGGLEDTFYRIYKKNPNALILYIVNFKLIDTVSKYYNENYDDFAAATKQVCEKWHVNYLDLHEHTELNATLQGNRAKYLPDGVHPSSAGYEIITPVVEQFLIDQVASYKANPQRFDPFSQVVSKIETSSSEDEFSSVVTSNQSSSNETMQNSSATVNSKNDTTNSIEESSNTNTSTKDELTSEHSSKVTSTVTEAKSDNSAMIAVIIIIGALIVASTAILVIILIKKRSK